ncbi:MAG: sensor histidine kinase [Streptosporangiaceae bacterium]
MASITWSLRAALRPSRCQSWPAWPPRTGRRWPSRGFGVLAAAPLVVRRKWPAATVAAVATIYVAAAFAGVRFTPFVSNAGPNFAIAVFTAADRSGRRSSLTATLLAVLATWAVLPLAAHLHPGQGQDAVQVAAAVPAWLAGDMVRARRLYRQRLELETHRRMAEKEGRARAEERLRLSRDVHDVVSHSLSMIAVRSGVARLLLDEQPGEARVALSAIETASRSALDELRHLLRQIRDPAAGDETAAPVLGDLPGLVDRLRESGLDLSYRCTGQPGSYSTALELSAYRIAQEALTNVAKHAPAARAWLEIAHGQSELTITITDDGPGPPQPAPQPPGLGIAGMRERAAMLDGQLTAQARPEGGFAVVARLPVRDLRR